MLNNQSSSGGNTASVAVSKLALRREMRIRLNGIASDSRAVAGKRVLELLGQCPEWRVTRAVGLYWPWGTELDISPLWTSLLQEGRTVAAPAYASERGEYCWRQVRQPEAEMAIRAFGVREPSPGCPELPADALEWVVVPGLAFDPEGGRLGRGKGHYDRLLAPMQRAIRCGIGFEEQVISKLPLEPHDIRLHYVITPVRLRHCRVGS